MEKQRFPFAGLPTGWFVVALSTEIPAGEVVRLRYFDRELIAYRGASGRAYVAGAYCPHLGAHLGHGGTIEGESIRCPFHRWRFEGEAGGCVEIPYADTIPRGARLEALPVREQNGAVHVFYDPAGGAPWALPELDDAGWTAGRTVHWRGLTTHAQEVFENTVDMAHIGPIHDGRGAALIGKPVVEGERMEVDLEFQAPGAVVGMPDQLNDVHLHVTLRGLGVVVVETHVRNVGVRARQRIYVTPIDAGSIDIRAVIHVRATDDAQFTEELAKLFYDAYVDDFAKDFPIWENKRYLSRPQLAKGDGPIGAYRRWCTQFYPERREPITSTEVAPAPSARAFFQPAADRLVSAAHLVLGAARRVGGSSRTLRAASGSATAPESAPASASARPSLPVRSARDYFETLERRFVPAAAAGIDAVFQWELGGEGGEVFHAEVRDGALRVAPGPHERPTVALVMAAGDYVRVVNGELDGMRAFTTGKGRIEGSLSAAMKMRSLFPA